MVATKICGFCGVLGPTKQCAKCGFVRYCGDCCRDIDWLREHNQLCRTWRRFNVPANRRRQLKADRKEARLQEAALERRESVVTAPIVVVDEDMAAERRQARENRRRLYEILEAGGVVDGHFITEINGSDGQRGTLVYRDRAARPELEDWNVRQARAGTISTMTRGGRWWPGRIAQYPPGLTEHCPWVVELMPTLIAPGELLMPLVLCAVCLRRDAVDSHTCEGCGLMRYCSDLCKRVHTTWHRHVCAELQAKRASGQATIQYLKAAGARRGDPPASWYSVDAMQLTDPLESIEDRMDRMASA